MRVVAGSIDDRRKAKSKSENVGVAVFELKLAVRSGRSKAVQELQIAELAVFAMRINLFERCEALRVAQVAAERDLAVQTVIDPGVVEIAQRPPAGCCASGIAEAPGLVSAATAIPKIVRVAEAERMELA